MASRRTLKGAFLAASALAVMGGASAHAVAAPAPVEIVAPLHHANDEVKAPVEAQIAQKAGIAALATAALAGLFHLIGARRLRAFAAAAGPVAAKTAAAVAKAPVAAARAVGRAAASPVRFVLLMGGLGIFALTGISVFDLEWTAGLALGAVTTVLAVFGLNGAKRALALTPARSKRSSQSR